MLSSFLILLSSAFLFFQVPTQSDLSAGNGKTMKTKAASISRGSSMFRDINLRDTNEIAVYPYNAAADELLPNEIAFAIKKSEVDRVLKVFDSPVYNGDRMGATPIAFIFFKDSKGRVAKAAIIEWEYLLFHDDWKNLYPVPTEVGEFLKERREKFCPRPIQ
jgi:hypothetical protein